MWPGFRAIHVKQEKKNYFLKNNFQLQESEEDDVSRRNNNLDNEKGILSFFTFNENSKIDNMNKDNEKLNLRNEKNKENENENYNNSIIKMHKKDLSTLKIVEPAFYWRVKRDYSNEVPDPFILAFIKGTNLRNIEESLLSIDIINIPRIVIHMDNSCKRDRLKAKKNKIKNEKNDENKNEYDKNDSKNMKNNHFFYNRNENDNSIERYDGNIINRYDNNNNNNNSNSYNNVYITNKTLIQLLNNNIYLNLDLPKFTLNPISSWAMDSVGKYRKYHHEHLRNIFLPKLELGERNPKKIIMDIELGYKIAQYIRPCDRILMHMRGNRSCFDKCE